MTCIVYDGMCDKLKSLCGRYVLGVRFSMLIIVCVGEWACLMRKTRETVFKW